MEWKTPLFKMYWDEEDIESVAEIIRRGSYWATGPEINILEEKISKYIGKKYGVTFNSGTSALHAILLANDITSGEVIVPSFTFISTANAVVLAGAKPVFAEIEQETFALDPIDVEKKITENTRAIMPVHYAGIPAAGISELKKIADEHDILLIEDAAESMGAKYKNKMVGTFGQHSMFSFCQNKIITAGEGGIILTDSKEIYDKLKLIRSHGRVETKEDYFSTIKDMDYIDVGYNFRLPSINAALLLSQFKKIENIINIRRSKAERYNKVLSEEKSIKIPLNSDDFYNVYQMYTIMLENMNQRNLIQQKLKENSIMSKIYFEPVHLKSFYKNKYDYKKGSLPITEDISNKVLTLPMHPLLDDIEIDQINNIIMNCL